MNKGEVTRQRIIAVAAPIFNQRGFAGCSMQDILDATGLEKGGLYRHFQSKEELAAEAFRYAWASAVKARTENLDRIENSLDKLRYVVRRFVEMPSSMPGGCPLINTAVDADDGNPELRQLARDAIQQWQRGLRSIVEQGIKRGEILKNVEPRRIANTLIATLEGALIISRVEGNKHALQDAGASLEIFLRDIAPENATA